MPHLVCVIKPQVCQCNWTVYFICFISHFKIIIE